MIPDDLIVNLDKDVSRRKDSEAKPTANPAIAKSNKHDNPRAKKVSKVISTKGDVSSVVSESDDTIDPVISWFESIKKVPFHLRVSTSLNE